MTRCHGPCLAARPPCFLVLPPDTDQITSALSLWDLPRYYAMQECGESDRVEEISSAMQEPTIAWKAGSQHVRNVLKLESKEVAVSSPRTDYREGFEGSSEPIVMDNGAL